MLLIRMFLPKTTHDLIRLLVLRGGTRSDFQWTSDFDYVVLAVEFYPSILFIQHRDIWYLTEDAFGGFGCFIDNAFGISDRFP